MPTETRTLTITVKLTEEDLRKARAWEKRNNYRYHNDEANLLSDWFASGEAMMIETESSELDEPFN